MKRSLTLALSLLLALASGRGESVTAKYDTTTKEIKAPTNPVFPNSITIGDSSPLKWKTRAKIVSPSDGVIQLTTNDGVSNGTLILGQVVGSTAANGDLIVNGTTSATKATSEVNIQSAGGDVTIGNYTTPGSADTIKLYGGLATLTTPTYPLALEVDDSAKTFKFGDVSNANNGTKVTIDDSAGTVSFISPSGVFIGAVRVPTISSTSTFTNKSMDGGSNTFTNIPDSALSLTNVLTTTNTKTVQNKTIDSSNTVANAALTSAIRTTTSGFSIDGGGSAITTGIKGYVNIPFGCTITGVTVLADQVGSIVVDIWKDTYTNYPPTVADTITASAKPTLSSAIKSQDTTLTGWTTSITSGDVLGFKVDSASTVTNVTVVLTLQK